MIVGMAVPTTVESSAATARAAMSPTVMSFCSRVRGGRGGATAAMEP